MPSILEVNLLPKECLVFLPPLAANHAVSCSGAKSRDHVAHFSCHHRHHWPNSWHCCLSFHMPLVFTFSFLKAVAS